MVKGVPGKELMVVRNRMSRLLFYFFACGLLASMPMFGILGRSCLGAGLVFLTVLRFNRPQRLFEHGMLCWPDGRLGREPVWVPWKALKSASLATSSGRLVLTRLHLRWNKGAWSLEVSHEKFLPLLKLLSERAPGALNRKIKEKLKEPRHQEWRLRGERVSTWGNIAMLLVGMPLMVFLLLWLVKRWDSFGLPDWALGALFMAFWMVLAIGFNGLAEWWDQKKRRRK